MPCRVNVVQGHFAADLLAEALDPEPGELLVHDDLLSCGPIRRCGSLEEWKALRAAYWDSPAASRAVRARDRERELLANLARLRYADSIVLWLGIGPAEQLLLAWMVKLLALIDVDIPNRLSVVQFSRFGDRDQGCWSVGLLNADEMRAHPAPEPVSPDAFAELERCWTAISSPDPTALLSFLAETSPRVPHLRPALRPLLDRYPDRRTGLGRWDAERLKYAAAMGPPATDMQACEVALTDAGAAVLGGDANAVELNGIDDWVLGVRLDSTERRVWYRKGDALVRA